MSDKIGEIEQTQVEWPVDHAKGLILIKIIYLVLHQFCKYKYTKTR